MGVGSGAHSSLSCLLEMQILVKNFKGNSISLDVDPTDSVLELKKKIQREEHHPVHTQFLTYLDKVLEDERTIAEYKIHENAIVTLAVRPPA